MTDPAAALPKRALRTALAVYLRPESLRMFALGFSSGLPLLLVLGTLSFRLREASIDRSTIGHLSWAGLAYGFKWVWSPLVDRLPLPILTRALGRRRSWLLLAQAAVAAGLLGMAWSDPARNLPALVGWTLLTAFGSATQDIALDAFRIESAPVREQPALAASYQTGYRLAMIWAGAGVLWLAARAEVAALGPHAYQNAAWRIAYMVMAASMAVGALTVLLSPEPARGALAPVRDLRQWLEQALVEPFAEFFRRYGWQALLVLALIAVYRISDVVMGIMANPFYVDMGYTKDQVAAVTKIYGVVMTLTGALVGGSLALRFGVMRILMLGACLSIVSNLLFAWLAGHGHDLTALIAVVSADNLAGGIASAAFVGYLSSLTNVRHSATQYALFSSLMLLLPKFIAGFSGDYVNAFGYVAFFTSTAPLGAPVLLLVWLAGRVKAQGQR
ncbi:MAG: MFS transporter [Burkholderiaceae bacterium]|jgi:PAT family beta-lactamase induction signal transducer AmpG|nr:MFS transporter [Burkholderiaceae bacterium]